MMDPGPSINPNKPCKTVLWNLKETWMENRQHLVFWKWTISLIELLKPFCFQESFNWNRQWEFIFCRTNFNPFNPFSNQTIETSKFVKPSNVYTKDLYYWSREIIHVHSHNLFKPFFSGVPSGSVRVSVASWPFSRMPCRRNGRVCCSNGVRSSNDQQNHRAWSLKRQRSGSNLSGFRHNDSAAHKVDGEGKSGVH